MKNMLEQFKEDAILFLEAGFVAVNQADEDAAVKLFKASKLLDPSNSMPTIGMGYMHLHKLELKKAIALFEEVLEKEPDNQIVKTFLGLCFSFSSAAVDKGEDILQEMKNSDDSQIQNLSESALDFIDKFIKKEPSPIEVSKPSTKKRKKK